MIKKNRFCLLLQFNEMTSKVVSYKQKNGGYDMFRKKIMSLVICFILVFSNSVVSNAYFTEGHKWENNTIYYYLDSSMSQKFKENYRTAANYWTNLTNITFTETFSWAGYMIKCEEANEADVYWDGWTNWWWDGYGYFCRADIKINRWYDYDYNLMYVGVTGHEFGHALGLAHHEGPYIMTEWQSDRYDTHRVYYPQQDDIDGVNSLYPSNRATLFDINDFNNEVKMSENNLSCIAIACWANSFPDLESVVNESDLIALVEIDSIHEEYMSDDDIPYTSYKANIIDNISGEASDEDIIISMNGINNKVQHIEVYDDPLMASGEKYLLFLNQNSDGTYKIINGPTGRLIYNDKLDTVTSLSALNKSMLNRNAVTQSQHISEFKVEDVAITSIKNEIGELSSLSEGIDVITGGFCASPSAKYSNLTELIENSDLIAFTEVETVFNSYLKNGIPWTLFNVNLKNVVYNNLDQQDIEQIIVRMNGISNDKMRLLSNDDPLMNVGGKYMLFLHYIESEDVFEIVGGATGRLTFDEGDNTVTSIVKDPQGTDVKPLFYVNNINADKLIEEMMKQD